MRKPRSTLNSLATKGRSPEKALQAIFKWHLDKWGDKHKRTVYRAVFTEPNEEALDTQWSKYGLMESWGTNKSNADLYVFQSGTLGNDANRETSTH